MFLSHRRPRQSNDVREIETRGTEALSSIPEGPMGLTDSPAPLFGKGRDQPWTQIHNQCLSNPDCFLGPDLKAAVQGCFIEVSISYSKASGCGCWILCSLHHSLALFTFQKLVVFKHPLAPWNAMGTIWECQKTYTGKIKILQGFQTFWPMKYFKNITKTILTKIIYFPEKCYRNIYCISYSITIFYYVLVSLLVFY